MLHRSARQVRSAFLLAVPMALASWVALVPQSGAQGYSVRDSAGIQLSVDRSPTDTTRLRVVQDLRIGTVAGDSVYEFHQVGEIAVDGSGTLFVANGPTRNIRVYDAAGRFQRQFGRRGQGPGEFSAISRIWFVGDTVAVTDRSASRFTLFRKTGDMIGTFSMRTPDNTRYEVIARQGNSWLGWVRPPSREMSLQQHSLMRDTTQLRTIDPVSHQAGALLRPHAGQRRIAWAELYPGSPLFEPRVFMSYGSGGSQYVSEGLATIDVYGANGRLVRRIRRDIAPQPITARDVERLKEQTLGGRRAGSEMAIGFGIAEKHPTAPYFQQIGALLVAPDGSFVMQRIDHADPLALERASGFGSRDRGEQLQTSEGGRWELLTAEGRYQGTVMLPQRFVARNFDGTGIIGVQKDEEGVEYVVRYRLEGVVRR